MKAIKTKNKTGGGGRNSRFLLAVTLLTFASGAAFAEANAIYSGDRIGTTRDAATVVASDRTLSYFVPRCAFLRPDSDKGISGPTGTAWAHFTETPAGTDELSTQFQVYHRDPDTGATLTSALVVRFFQDGADIRAYLEAAYVSAPFEHLVGQDMAALHAAGDSRVKAAALATGSSEGYGIAHIVLTAKVASETVQGDYASLTNGDIAVAAGTRLVLDDYAKFEYEVPGGTLASNVVAEGELVLRNMRGTFSGTVSGSGDVVVNTDKAHVEKAYFGDFIPVDTSWNRTNRVIIAKGRQYEDIAGVSGRLYYKSAADGGSYSFTGYSNTQFSAGGWLVEGDVSKGTDKRIVGAYLCFVNYQGNLEAQIVKSPRAVYYKNATNENIVAVCGVGGPYLGMDIYDSRLVSGTDFTGVSAYYPTTLGSASPSGVYGWQNMTVTFKDGSSTTVELAGDLDMTVGGVIRAEGVEANPADLFVSGEASAPKYGKIEVGEYANAKVSVRKSDWTGAYADDAGSWTVLSNGFLQSWGYTATTHLPPVNVMGGTFKVSGHRDEYAGQTGRTQSSLAYLNQLVLADGATVTSSLPVFVGMRHSPVTSVVWKVTGSAPSVVRGTIALTESVSYSPTPRFVVSVDDVTGDSADDLTIAGAVLRYNDVSDDSLTDNLSLVKAGKGTLFLQGLLHAARPTYVGEGVLKLGDSIPEADADFPQDIVLDGGALEVADGTVNAAGTLTVAAKTARLVLGEGATLSFADSSAVAWPADAEIEIVGDLEKSSLRFGTSPRGLTRAQKACLRHEGREVRLDGSGYVREKVGSVLVVR